MSDDGCACYCGSGDPDLPEFISEAQRAARKEHRCCECQDTILIGEKYWYVVGRWDGRFETFKTCTFCHGERRAFERRTESPLAFGELGCALYCELTDNY